VFSMWFAPRILTRVFSRSVPQLYNEVPRTTESSVESTRTEEYRKVRGGEWSVS
jgi:hypothetical protein